PSRNSANAPGAPSATNRSNARWTTAEADDAPEVMPQTPRLLDGDHLVQAAANRRAREGDLPRSGRGGDGGDVGHGVAGDLQLRGRQAGRVQQLHLELTRRLVRDRDLDGVADL